MPRPCNTTWRNLYCSAVFKNEVKMVIKPPFKTPCQFKVQDPKSFLKVQHLWHFFSRSLHLCHWKEVTKSFTSSLFHFLRTLQGRRLHIWFGLLVRSTPNPDNHIPFLGWHTRHTHTIVILSASSIIVIVTVIKTVTIVNWNKNLHHEIKLHLRGAKITKKLHLRGAKNYKKS